MLVEGKDRGTKISARPPSARAAGLTRRKARRGIALHLLVLAALSLVLYAGALRNDFVTDDALQLRSNPLITNYHYIPKLFSTNVWSFLRPTLNNYYRPLHMLFYMGEYYLFGMRPWPFHLVNLLLNVAVIFAAYFLVRALADEKLALWAVLLFAFQPIHVEAVVWIAALPELLCSLSLFTGVRLYHEARMGIHPARSQAAATAVFFFGLFCKETTLVFPALLLAYEFFYRRESLRSIALGFRRFLPYLCALGIYIAIRLRVLGSFAPASAHFTPHQTFLTAPVLLCQYIFKLLWPVNMNYYYYFTPQNTLDWKFLGSAALIGALILAMFWLRKSQPLLAFALAWFFITIAPVLSISSVGENVFTERYLYIPSLGFCILGGWAWLRVSERASRRMALTLAYPAVALVLVFYSVLIIRRIPDWRSDLRLFQKTALQSPDSATVQQGLGIAYYEAGQYDLAAAPFERAIALRPASPDPHLYLAVTLSALGDTQGANAELLHADKLPSADELLWTLYGQTYVNLKQWDRAIYYFRKELSLEPRNPALYTALGDALQENGETDESIAALRQALRIEPGYPDASIDLAITLAQHGDMNQAISLLLSALRTHTDGPHADAAWFNLGNVYANEAEWNSAASAYQHALDLNPDLAAARQRLDSVEAQMAAGPQ